MRRRAVAVHDPEVDAWAGVGGMDGKGSALASSLLAVCSSAYTFRCCS